MAKKKIENYTFYPGIGLNEAVHPNAKWLLENNKTFIQFSTDNWQPANHRHQVFLF